MKGCSRHGSLSKKESKSDVAFRIFDENKDGYITKQEMRKLSNMTKIQVCTGKKITIRRKLKVKSNRIKEQ